MRKTLAAIVVAGAVLAGIAAASPALAASRPIALLCSPSSNGGTLVNGVCVLPAASVGQPYEAFLLTSNGAVDTFTITKGSLPPGLSMPATYGAAEHQRDLQHHGRVGTAAGDHLPEHLLHLRDSRLVLLPELLHLRRGRPVHLDGGGRQAPARRGPDPRPPGRHPDSGRHLHVHHQGHRQRREPGHRTGQHHHLALIPPDPEHTPREWISAAAACHRPQVSAIPDFGPCC